MAKFEDLDCVVTGANSGIINRREARPSKRGRDDDAARQLWELSEELTAPAG